MHPLRYTLHRTILLTTWYCWKFGCIHHHHRQQHHPPNNVGSNQIMHPSYHLYINSLPSFYNKMVCTVHQSIVGISDAFIDDPHMNHTTLPIDEPIMYPTKQRNTLFFFGCILFTLHHPFYNNKRVTCTSPPTTTPFTTWHLNSLQYSNYVVRTPVDWWQTKTKECNKKNSTSHTEDGKWHHNSTKCRTIRQSWHYN